jgi:ABC-2 type transport system permease protein
MSGLRDAFRGEWAAIRTDHGALMVLVLAVLVYPLVYPVPYLTEIMREVPVIAVDEDHSALSRQLVRMADATEAVRITGSVGAIAEAEDAVRRGRAGGVLVTPAGFERGVRRGKPVTVGAYADASYMLIYRQVLTGLSQTAATLSAGIEIRRLRAAGAADAAARSARDPLPLLVRPLYNEVGGYGHYVVPGVLVIVLQQTLLIGIGLLAGTTRERGGAAGGAGRAGRGETLAGLAGRVGAYLSLYAIHALYVFGLVYRLLGLPLRGSALVLAAYLLPFLLAVILLGLTVARAFRTREAAIQTLLFTSLPAVFLAGFSWPFESIPGPLRAIASLLPSTLGVDGILRITQLGAGLGDVVRSWAWMWVLVLIFGVLAYSGERRAAARKPFAPPSPATESVSPA